MTAVAAPIPIAFCITELDRGGAERALSQLVLGLNRDEWHPRVYCLGPRGYFADVIEAGGVAVECFGGRGIAASPAVLLRLTNSLRRFRPRVLQTFLFHANILGRVAARLAGVPCVVSGIRVADRRSKWYGRIDRWTNWLVDHNVCVSQGVADFAISESRLPRQKISVIPNGVDSASLKSVSPADLTSLGIPDGSKTFITVGRLEQQKGIDVLLDAAAEVLLKVPNSEFLIVGAGHQRTALVQQAQRLQIEKHVHFLGHRTDVPELLRACTAFVLPSRWEGMSNAILEAMAIGIPVVATAVEGTTDLIHDGTTGRCVPVDHPRELAKAIIDVVNHEQLSRKMAEIAQQIATKGYTPYHVAIAYSQLYRCLALPK